MMTALKDGEVLVGSTIGASGRITHTILLPDELTPATWMAARAWANERRGDLPTLAEWAVMREQHRKLFKDSALYWSSERVDDGIGYQSFVCGCELPQGGGWPSHGMCHARAVRRVVEGGL